MALCLPTLVCPGLPAVAQLSEPDVLPMNKLNTLQFGPSANDPIKLDRKQKPSLNDLFPLKEIEGAGVQPLSLGKVVIPGLSPGSMQALSINHFVVASNVGESEMSSIYRWNRENGKPNFVTVDSLLHPYFGFRNALFGAVIEEHLCSDMLHLLNATIAATTMDYREAEDEEVKDDLQRNLAYLTVGLKLLDPAAKLPDIGGAEKLVKVDYESCVKGRRAKSVIFNQNVDFSYCVPWGWYAKSEKVSRFYRCYQWLSRVYFPFRNVTVNTVAGGGNSFRRAVLLYRSLSLARVGEAPALGYWNRIGNVFSLCGIDNYYKIHTILPPDLASVLDRSRGSFARLLDIVSQPYARTKLMLQIRKQRPVSLGSTSIFEIGSGGKAPSDLEVFRFLPLIQPAEDDWLKHVAHEYKTETDVPTPTPLSLLVSHAHGSVRATNLLALQLSTLDPRLLTAVPRLERIISIANGGRGESEFDRRWRVLSELFRPYPDKVQVVLRTNLWSSRQLETAMAAWIDSYTAYNPVANPRTESGGKAGNAKSDGGAAPSSARPASFQYLEPRPMVYHLMARDLEDCKSTLSSLAVYPKRYDKRLEDFRRLFARLEEISKREILGEPVLKQDFNLLANFDLILKEIDFPIADSIFFNLGQAYGTEKKEGEGEGATIGTGEAGRLFLIANTTQGATLCRGPVYTVYEVAGGPYPLRHWQRKIQFDLLQPPIWARLFDFIQSREAPRQGKASTPTGQRTRPAN